MKWNESLSWSWEKIVNSAEEDHIPDRQQSKTKWALRSDYVFSETHILCITLCILSRYSNLSKIKNANRMMNINDNLVASLELLTKARRRRFMLVVHFTREHKLLFWFTRKNIFLYIIFLNITLLPTLFVWDIEISFTYNIFYTFNENNTSYVAYL